MSKIAKNKVCFGVLILLAMTLLSSICFCSLNWSYLVDCTHAFEEVDINWFQKGLHCYGTTEVELGGDYAGTIVYLKKLDSDGDWGTYTAWEDKDETLAVVQKDYTVPDGTYKLEIKHSAYLSSDLTTPVEIHWSETPSITVVN